MFNKAMYVTSARCLQFQHTPLAYRFGGSSWDDIASDWKDIRRIHADYLIDDSPRHRDEVQKYGLELHYIVIPAYGSPEDCQDSLL